jgi:two-component system sensor histidine kinase CpxA
VDAAHVEPVDMHELLEGVVADAQFEAESKGCKASLDVSSEAVVNGNALLLRSAIENVIRNAVKYTKPGTAVEISMRKDAEKSGGIIIHVRDHGPGVPEEILPHLFEPFVRVEAARDRSSGGHGLGLAIADRAIRLYGGGITARNEHGEGLSVLIRLPLAQT